MAPRAVVFANHEVGVRCLSAVMAAGIEVPLVVTHDEEPVESAGFASVAELATINDLPLTMPRDARDPQFVRRVVDNRPDFIFSFYFRQLLPQPMLEAAPLGALNMHGSLLPRYRGRAPVNWAVIRGEKETGATLHYMTQVPDAGDIVDQQAVPILPDDTAFEVLQKIAVAAEMILCRTLPALAAGTAPRIAQDPAAATYCGRRHPEDGAIDWAADATRVHDLVRGVAPPYPGAFTVVAGRGLRILRTRRCPDAGRRSQEALLYIEADRCFAQCGGGGVVQLIETEVDGAPVAPSALGDAFGSRGPWPLQCAAPRRASS